MKPSSIDDLKTEAKRVRCDVLSILKKAGSGHPGGSLSCVELLTALYGRFMRVKSDEPDWEERDRLVLSKGHASATLYTILARRGFFPYEELFNTFRQIDSRFQAHPDMKKTPGIDMSTGSLGQGLSVGNGMMLGLMKKKSDAKVYVLLGDGECQEGQIWEAAMTAAHYRLAGVTVIIDYNKVQLDGTVAEIKSLQDLAGHWRTLNWHVQEIDGHDIAQIIGAVEKAHEEKARPSVIIANTIKGKGVPFMEGNHAYHGQVPPADIMQKEIDRLKGEL